MLNKKGTRVGLLAKRPSMKLDVSCLQGLIAPTVTNRKVRAQMIQEQRKYQSLAT